MNISVRTLFPALYSDNYKVMIFVDGENLAIQTGRMLTSGRKKQVGVTIIPDIAVWTPDLAGPMRRLDILRLHYYTAMSGSHEDIKSTVDTLKAWGIAAPRVFKKAKDAKSKCVDVALTVDMLHHGQKGHYDIGVLVAGDKDYVPLVKAVQSEGRLVCVWFVSRGLSRELRIAADHFGRLDDGLFEPLAAQAEVPPP
ncbi:MAG: NYN domain-containing protein [Planctomycetota bacterium]